MYLFCKEYQTNITSNTSLLVELNSVSITQLTSVSLIYILHSSVQYRAASLLNPADYYCSYSALSDWSLIQEPQPELNSFCLLVYNHLAYMENESYHTIRLNA